MPYNAHVFWYESMYITDKDGQSELNWRMKKLAWTATDVEATFLDLIDGLEESLETAPRFLKNRGHIYDTFDKEKSETKYVIENLILLLKNATLKIIFGIILGLWNLT